MKRFRFGIFIISAIVIFVLTGLSFVAAFGRDEGTLDKDDGIVWTLLADSFDIFRQPTHGLFWDLIIENGGLFMSGLLFNILFWSLLVERMTSLGDTLIRRVREGNVR
jgi:hypothetical protein